MSFTFSSMDKAYTSYDMFFPALGKYPLIIMYQKPPGFSIDTGRLYAYSCTLHNQYQLLLCERRAASSARKSEPSSPASSSARAVSRSTNSAHFFSP